MTSAFVYFDSRVRTIVCKEVLNIYCVLCIMCLTPRTYVDNLNRVESFKPYDVDHVFL